MSHKRLTTWQKATALVPLALLSGAWTTSLAVTSSASASTRHTTLPDGTSVPDQALKAPASMSRPGSIAPGVPAGASQSIIQSASTNGIPAAALAAYQRAQQVINSADKSCNLPWQLIAAIGRVESDHGRYGGNVLAQNGISHPGIYGIPLDGSNNTQQVKDTDGGQYDGDPIYDRAVGPMQFIPQTWSIVGVDGDGDGKRNPQDIYDASLATAVYLCSGDEDLATLAGQKASVYRYNHSQEYVDLVIAIMQAYMKGDYSAVPNGVATSTVFVPSSGDAVVSPATAGKPQAGPHHRAGTRGGHKARSGSGRAPGTAPSTGGSGGSTPAAPAPGGVSGTGDPSKTAGGTVSGTVDKTTNTAGNTVSALDQAKATCQANFTSAQIAALGGLDACANAVLKNGLKAVTDSLTGLVGGGTSNPLP